MVPDTAAAVRAQVAVEVLPAWVVHVEVLVEVVVGVVAVVAVVGGSEHPLSDRILPFHGFVAGRDNVLSCNDQVFAPVPSPCLQRTTNTLRKCRRCPASFV
jgi:hypothetical protein